MLAVWLGPLNKETCVGVQGSSIKLIWSLSNPVFISVRVVALEGHHYPFPSIILGTLCCRLRNNVI